MNFFSKTHLIWRYFSVAASVVTRATIGGVIEQYHIPLSEWTSSMYAIQSAMIFVYSL
ncbi:DUF2534 family protein, partial [Salmonella enterica subsp. enterica serovar Give]|nr:DUF2534 family protein [Salmonella enterica subsp. enterica serovar Give]